MNVTYTSALLLTFGFLASSLLLAVSPQISIRSQGQNIIHSALQQTKKHIPGNMLLTSDAPVNTVPVSTVPVNTVPVSTVPVNSAQKKQTETPTFFEKIVTALAPRGSEQTPEQQTPVKTTTPATPLVKEKEQETPTMFQKITSSTTSLKEASPASTKIPGPTKKIAPKRLKDTPSTLITPKKNTSRKNLSTLVTPTLTQTSVKKKSQLLNAPPRILQSTNSIYIAHDAQTTDASKAQKTTNTQTKKRLHRSAPADTKPLPAVKKINQKNNTPSCSTVTKISEKYPALGDTELSPSAAVFERYPAIQDKTTSAHAQVFEKYPAIEDKALSPSAAVFETYPAIGCEVHETESLQQLQQRPSSPVIKKDQSEELVHPARTKKQIQKQKKSRFEPVVAKQTSTIGATQTVESTQPLQQAPTAGWLDATKNTYQKSVSYFKELFSAKKSLDNVPLSSAPLDSAQLNSESLKSAPLSTSLNSQNAATEVHSIDPLNADRNIAGNFTLQLEVMRSFRPHALTRALFGCDLYNDTTIHIRGSALTRNEEKDWLADYFYLSNNYESIVCFTPRVTSFLTDLSLFIDLNSWFKGSFLRMQSPLTWTKWDLGMREQIINSGNVTGTQGWHGNWTSADNKLLSSFTDYAAWEKAGTSYTDGVGLASPLYAAKLCSCGKAQTALADIHVDFGLHAHEGEHYHVGIYARGVMPTGTHPTGNFLFEPIVGNGHHWELGGGINGYAQLWTDKMQSKEVGLYVDGSITHLFNARQQRVFDLKNHGPLSRYLLVTNSATAPASITPAANITCAQINVSIPVQIDLVALVNFANDVFSWNVGYNFWARSCEKIDCCDIITSQLCDNCSAASGLDGITWKPYADSTIKNLGTSSLAPALSQNDLDLQASRTKGSSHKFFTSLNYSWIELDDVVVPFLGIGTEIEFGKSSAVSSNTCCNHVSLSQWGLWLRAGTEF